MKFQLFSSHGLVLVGGVLTVSLAWFFFDRATPNPMYSDPADQAVFGQWGDKFGALNCLFAGFGFVAIVATLRYQHDENVKKNTEAKELMQRLERTAAALERQAEMGERAQYLQLLITELEHSQAVISAARANAKTSAQSAIVNFTHRESPERMHAARQEVHQMLGEFRKRFPRTDAAPPPPQPD